MVESDRIVRSAGPGDAAEMLAIYEPVVRQTAISFELEPPTIAELAARIVAVTATDPWLVVEREGQLAGYAYATRFRSRPAYEATRETTVYVHPDHRGAGVARQLMEALIGELTAGGTRLVVAGIALPNEASIALHEGLGFTHVGTFHDVGRKFDRWHDVGFWELRCGLDADTGPTGREP